MAMTGAEKQASHRARIVEKTAFLEAANEALTTENADLRAKLDKAATKIKVLQKKLKTLTEAA
jgi:uncharacterized coiled-coil protein SlyX